MIDSHLFSPRPRRHRFAERAPASAVAPNANSSDGARCPAAPRAGTQADFDRAGHWKSEHRQTNAFDFRRKLLPLSKREGTLRDQLGGLLWSRSELGAFRFLFDAQVFGAIAVPPRTSHRHRIPVALRSRWAFSSRRLHFLSGLEKIRRVQRAVVRWGPVLALGVMLLGCAPAPHREESLERVTQALSIHQGDLSAGDGVAGDEFGLAVAISGDTAIVGVLYADDEEGAAYVFVRS